MAAASPGPNVQVHGYRYDHVPTIQRFAASDALVRCLMGPVGCLPAETEFLTPHGWRRMDAYEPGDQVGQWHPETGMVAFAEPIEHVQGPAAGAIRFENRNTLGMVLTPEHRVPLYDYAGRFTVKTAQDLAARPSRHHVPVSFRLDRADVQVTNERLRLQVAVAADGTLPKQGRQCVVALRKERKKRRLRALLSAAGVEWKERTYHKRPTEIVFTFQRGDLQNRLPAWCWHLSSTQLEVLLDEAVRWDGFSGSGESRFYTTDPDEAALVQLAAHATGSRATIASSRDRRHPEWSENHVVHIAAPGSQKSRVMLRDSTTIEHVPLSWCYCFRTATGFFVARHEGRVFITGNSGKSSGCCWEVFRRAIAQAPGPDGVRRTRCAIVRNTDKELLDTTIKTWMEWFPAGVAGTWRKSERTFILRARDRAGRLAMQCEVLFRAMDIPKQVRDLLSLELTFAWLNEAREIEEEIFRGLLNKGRLGRYPPRKDGGATWRGVWLDTNPPDDVSWIYRVFEEDTLDDPRFALFKQPSGRGPHAENLPNLIDGYYEDAAAGSSEQYVKVYIDGEYGTVEEGRPVYRRQWNDRLHVSEFELVPVKRRPIAMGWDFGLNPSVVIAQRMVNGQLRVIDEVIGEGMGVRQLIRTGLKPLLAQKYRGLEIEVSRGDPAGEQRSQTDALTPFDIIEEEGLPIEGAPSNDPDQRWEWVRYWLTQLHDGQPMFLLSPRCRQLRRGFNGRYKFRRLQVVGAERRYAERAEKNDVSHPHDALQYLCSGYVPEDLSKPGPPRADYRPADRVAGV